MKKNHCLLFVGMLTFSGSAVFAQQERADSLVKELARKELVPKENFREMVFIDFSKLLNTDMATGKALSFASFTLDKPSAEASYSIRPKITGERAKKYVGWLNQSFISLSVKGGFESGIINVVKDQKPAKGFLANFSYSQMIRPFYFYLNEQKYRCNAMIKSQYDSIYTSCADHLKLDSLNIRLSTLGIGLDNLLKAIPSDNQKIIDATESYGQTLAERDTIAKKIRYHTGVKKRIFDKTEWSSKGLLWFTFNQQAGGLKFYGYDSLNVAEKYHPEVNSNTFQTSLTVNYYYKSSFGSFWSKLLRNSLFSLGTSLGYYNNFDQLTASELKESIKVGPTTGNTTYGKGNTYTVYSGEKAFAAYHAGRLWIEGYKMFSSEGTLGLRMKFMHEIPYTGIPNGQSNLESGMVFNAIGKDGKAKVSFEVFYTFYDLNGNNVAASNTGQKFYERNLIGVKTAVPFSF
jgi:hypothetical protein